MPNLAQTWTDFLRSPNVDSLSDDATLTVRFLFVDLLVLTIQYITSCKQFSGAREIVKQLSINSEGLKSLRDEVTCTHEAANSLVSEVAASFIFDFDGRMNPFLPGLEDNMYSGKRVEVPLVYSVTFASHKIRAIRVFWDQATVLKQIDVIGTRGRGWPVYDGAEQSRLLKAGFKPEPFTQPAQNTSRPTTGTYDPHASLHLFEQQPEDPRSDYGPQDYQRRVKAEPSNYEELFVNEQTARPDELTQRLGVGKQRQVTLNQSQFDKTEDDIRNMRLNESIGHAGRTSHFEFGTPDARSSDFQKNEIPLHHKAGMQDHNRTTEESDESSMRAQPRPEGQTHFQLGTDSPSPALQRGGNNNNNNNRGPPQASFDAFSDQKPEHNVHGREYNMARRPPPQSQFDFMSGDNEAAPLPASRAASHNYSKAQKEPEETGNIHNREFNMSRRPPPQAQYDFVEDSAAQTKKSEEFSQERFTPRENAGSDNIHGREYNMSRRPPPQAQYNFMEESSVRPQENFGRSSQRNFTPVEEPKTDNIHGREYNMSRRPPPQAQYDFMGDTSAKQDTNFGRTSQRNFSPSYDFGDDASDQTNIHGRTHNMGRQGPPAPQSNFFG
ncbi:Putative uncharacterized protein [Taphrina deformans PYCC 5710]|uniref:Uncharacterized protein n=1 Tax=Taphrina deformans (strain PYCC 5710 / ATCC 11124 / CBS 356.35 / IMI 108563 / JCM 9778 / NBRC 8474) TaxID=1097556 RepID=R4XC81_TAPDE|nr:Putative uncharacterized protein [Taphrina deformans PYCC 5710]|eukprot:CCG83175.1 Putative uncharacterized protein [Taphrina deformans PYCC 5710]